MENVKVLAVIPAYNSAQYIERTIFSILKQDYSALDILVIDDCSSDNTLEILERYKGDIQILRNDSNLGFSYSLNRAIPLAKDAKAEFIFILEDDTELIDSDYITRGLDHFTNENVALVCGQAVDFNSNRLSLAKRAFARYLNLDYQENKPTIVSYSILKSDLIRVEALESVGGFGFAGNPKLGAEDQILGKALRDKGMTLIKDNSLRYRLDFARTGTLLKCLKSERNAGWTVGVAVSQGIININPVDSAETRKKVNFRRGQVISVLLICASFILFAFSYRIALAVIPGLIALRCIYYLSRSKGFRYREKPYFIGVGILNDFNFSIPFYLGVIAGIWNKVLDKIIRKTQAEP
jgi:glycosyltransferase involved in cell wall biosynthesis